MQKHLVLVGAGHANLYLASQAEDFIRRGYQVTLVDPDSFWYSGMATGMLSGSYDPEDDQVDAQALIESHGGDYVQATVAQVETARQQLQLDDGTWLRYDFLCLNVGSHALVDMIPGAKENDNCWPVKPIVNLYKLRQHLQSCFDKGESVNIVVVGGGPTGCEVTANILGLAERSNGRVQLTLAASGERLLPQFPEKAGRSLYRNLLRRGVRVLCNTRVTGYAGATATLDSGEEIEADVLVPAVGLAANPLAQKIRLPCDSKNGLSIQATLNSPADAKVFAAGDCAALEGHNLPKLGVFGVREASCIHHNILAAIDGRPLKNYVPQKRYLAILNLGDGTGLAVRGGLWWQGRASLWLKNYIDRRFVEGYQREYS